MAINRRIVTISIDTANTSNYNTELEAAWNTACSGGDFTIAHVEKRVSASNKEAYTLWLEEVV